MARQSKDAKIKELEQRVSLLQENLATSSARITKMTKQAESSFLNSSTFFHMQEEINFLKSLNNLNDTNLANAHKSVKRADKTIREIYEDNKRMCANQGNTDYWAGITENQRNAIEYQKLKDEICRLEGIIEQKNLSITSRDEEINRLQWVVANERADKFLSEKDCSISPDAPIDSISRTMAIIERNIEQEQNKKICNHSGRPTEIDNQKIELIGRLRGKGYSIRNIAKQLNISVGSVHRYSQMFNN